MIHPEIINLKIMILILLTLISLMVSRVLFLKADNELKQDRVKMIFQAKITAFLTCLALYVFYNFDNDAFILGYWSQFFLLFWDLVYISDVKIGRYDEPKPNNIVINNRYDSINNPSNDYY